MCFKVSIKSTKTFFSVYEFLVRIVQTFLLLPSITWFALNIKWYYCSVHHVFSAWIQFLSKIWIDTTGKNWRRNKKNTCFYGRLFPKVGTHDIVFNKQKGSRKCLTIIYFHFQLKYSAKCNFTSSVRVDDRNSGAYCSFFAVLDF